MVEKTLQNLPGTEKIYKCAEIQYEFLINVYMLGQSALAISPFLIEMTEKWSLRRRICEWIVPLGLNYKLQGVWGCQRKWQPHAKSTPLYQYSTVNHVPLHYALTLSCNLSSHPDHCLMLVNNCEDLQGGMGAHCITFSGKPGNGIPLLQESLGIL